MGIVIPFPVRCMGAVSAMSGWIKFDKDMAEDPRLFQSACKLLDQFMIASRSGEGFADLSKSDASRFVRNALLGGLVTLWTYADTHVRDDDLLPCDAKSLDVLVGIDGFCALLPQEWVEILPNGMVRLPGYCAKNALISRRNRREAGAERQRKFRQRHTSVTNAGSNGKSNGKSNGVTNASVTVVDLDLDLDKNKIGQRPSAFDLFWSTYPKKVKRKTTAEIWNRKRLDSKSDELITDVQRRLQSDKRWRDGYIPDPTTYLNQERWGDEMSVAKRPRIEGI